MIFRKVVSLVLALSFVVVLATGVASFYYNYSRWIATLHTVFGLVLAVGVLFHLWNNLRPIKSYIKWKRFPFVFGLMVLVFCTAFYQLPPVRHLMDYGARHKAEKGNGQALGSYDVITLETDNGLGISVDLMHAEHFWHPQIAIWIEDLEGNHLKTLFVTNSTAKGLFFGGRTKENFKVFDTEKASNKNYRKVNALPVWSHTRGEIYSDGMVVPTREDPLPEAISGATPPQSFFLKTSVREKTSFVIKLEINVAFDDNEFYSEYDFPDDEVFHNGTGQLGQPSLVYAAKIDLKEGKNYYLMEVLGHGHHSGEHGAIETEMATLTTAKQIVERIVIGVSPQEP